MDAYTLYEYCHKQNIVPFIDLKKQKQMAPVTKMISLIQENNGEICCSFYILMLELMC